MRLKSTCEVPVNVVMRETVEEMLFRRLGCDVGGRTVTMSTDEWEPFMTVAKIGCNACISNLAVHHAFCVWLQARSQCQKF